MVAFLMLGIVPGTNIQISFANWVLLMCLLIALLAMRAVQKKRLPLILLIALTIRRSTKRLTRTRLALPA